MEQHIAFACARWQSSLSFVLLLLSCPICLLAFFPSETSNTNFATDRLALLSFKSLISDDPLGALTSWGNDSLHFCKWRGVTCHTRGRHQPRVIALELQSLDLSGLLSPSVANLTFLQRLNLSDNRLRGPIPKELGFLSHLHHLDLSFNSLRDMIPSFLFQNCSHLRSLSLDHNSINGTIPSNLSHCWGLQYLSLANNMLEGGIPSELGVLPKLNFLSLRNNSLTSSIPPEICHLVDLNILDLSSNQINGTIPAAIGNLSSLTSLYLSSNRLVGAIPVEIGKLVKLNALSLWNNSLTSSIPPEICHLVDLNILYLGSNQINGTIPAAIGNLSSLTSLYLSSNRLVGAIPVEIGKLVKLKFLSLWNNSLTSSIPPEICHLVDLNILYLGSNQINGTIPAAIGNLSSLTSLSLSSNRLVGAIPATIGNLTALTTLDLGSNNLRGVIPPSIWNLSSLIELYVENNDLQGTLPHYVGDALPQLQILQMNSNLFSGSLPISLSKASKLKQIQLSDNRFNGTIPRSLGSLQGLSCLHLGFNWLEARNDAEWSFLDALTNNTILRRLDLSANKLAGMLPRSIANLSKTLEVLYLGGNQIAGSIPLEIGNLINLILVNMRSNHLDGVIPATLGSLPMLGGIDLSENYFTGVIPTTLGNLTLLSQLSLFSNELHGSIPSSLGHCRLDTLDLSFNKLTGTIPGEILSIPTLASYLDISHNSLTGSLPSEVGKLKNLIELDISQNRLWGVIPSSFQECQVLGHLRMRGNFFQGSIPSSFSQLKGLQEMDLSQNNLSGSIPEFLGVLPLLSSLNLSFNNFEGEVPEDGIFQNTISFSVVGNHKLCGGVQQLNLPPCSDQSHRKNHLSQKLLVIILIASGIVCLIVLLSFVCTFHWICKSKKEPPATTSIKDRHKRISYAELLKATNDFSTENLLGVGSFGTVYKASMNYNEYDVVAVKVLNLHQEGSSKSFIAECEALKNILHRNLVKILTACVGSDFKGNDFKALVFEFFSNGNLDKCLHSKANEQSEGTLSLIQRINILIDVASALDYLHHHGPNPIVHCDIKPSNVLLDNDMVAHLGDFGLARFLNKVPIRKAHISSSSLILKGTIGYVAPEYGVANKASIEGDVYSYGVLLLETFTGKRPTDEAFNDGVSLRQHVEMALPERVMEIIDPSMHFEEEDKGAKGRTHGTDCITERATVVECIISALRIGIKCTKESPLERKQIGEAINELVAIRQVLFDLKLQGGRSGKIQLIRSGEDPSTIAIY